MDITQANLHLVQTLDDALAFKNWLGNRRDWLGSDIETEGLHLGRDQIRLVQFGDMTDGWSIPYDDWKGLIKEAYGTYTGRVVFHNALFDTRFLKRDGIIVPNHQVEDTMVMAHLLDSSSSIALKTVASRRVHPAANAGKDALGMTIKNVEKESKIVPDWEWEKGDQSAKRPGVTWDWASFPVDHPAYWLYSALDTCLTAALAEKIWPDVVYMGSQYIYEIEMGAIHVLRDAELRGMKVSPGYLTQQRNAMWAIEKQLQEEFGSDVKLGSDAEVIRYLQSEGAGQLLTKKTRGGRTALDEEVLAGLAATGRYPIAKKVHDYRYARKMRTSYFDKMLALQTSDHVVHPSVKPLGARTGRMSVTDPALQTIPRGKLVRDAFVARDGHQIISADFSQIEYRVLAHFSGEEKMIQAFLDGLDLHNFTAQMAYGLGDVEPTPAQRQIAKNGSFAKLYGAGDEKFAATVGVSLQAAQEFMINYARAFPGVDKFMKDVVNVVCERAHEAHSPMGYVTTPYGRRLQVERYEAYKGVNYLIQSTATADTLKLKMCQLAAAGLGDYILLPIHDEVLFEAPDDRVEEVREVVQEVMPDLTSFRVPLTISISGGVHSWGDAK